MYPRWDWCPSPGADAVVGTAVHVEVVIVAVWVRPNRGYSPALGDLRGEVVPPVTHLAVSMRVRVDAIVDVRHGKPGEVNADDVLAGLEPILYDLRDEFCVFSTCPARHVGMIMATRTTASGHLRNNLSIRAPSRCDATSGGAVSVDTFGSEFMSLVSGCCRMMLGRWASDASMWSLMYLIVLPSTRQTTGPSWIRSARCQHRRPCLVRGLDAASRGSRCGRHPAVPP